jgi:hypothetical protein
MFLPNRIAGFPPSADKGINKSDTVSGRLEEPEMKHKRALSVATAAAALLALSAVRFGPADAIPITGLVAACSVLLALARRRRRA